MNLDFSSQVFAQLYNKYWKWLDGKLGLNNSPISTLQRRTLNTALTIIANLQTISFLELSSSVFYASEDVQFKQFTRLYESQLELAGADSDKFIKGLHSFYNSMSNKIKKENLYSDFFDFISLFGRLRMKRYEDQSKSNSKYANNTYNLVVDCYYCLLLQNLEYLRPNKFDFTTVICGITTDGQLITTKDCHPNLDIPAYTVEREFRQNKFSSKEDILKRLIECFAQAGYQINSFEDAELLNNVDRSFTNHIAILLPFINEYNSDLLPSKWFTTFLLPFYTIKHNLPTDSYITDKLHHRSSMLPNNGVIFELDENAFINKVTMKETFYNDSIWMIYKAETAMGDLSGVYDTKSSFFFSVIQDFEDQQPFNSFRSLILYLYACATTKEGQILLSNLSQTFYYGSDDVSDRIPISAQMFLSGGKLKPVSSISNGTRLSDPRFESTIKSIQGYIRKVGKGRTPSHDAVMYAQSLGLFLAPDETYVRPFVKHVLKLKISE